MGTVQWLLKKITKIFGRSTNSLFYTLLYREILKEINEITENEEDTLVLLREIGKRASFESCNRHPTVFKFMPGNPQKVLEYFELLWVVVFGKELAEGDLTHEEIVNKDSKYNEYKIKIKTCPICAGYGQDDEDTFDFRKISNPNTEGLACGLTGMLESVANYILNIKKSEYRISIYEQKCMAKAEECLQFTCKIYDVAKWEEMYSINIQDQLKSGVLFEESVGESEIPDSKSDFFDKLQDVISLDKIEELLDAPLEGIKKKVAEVIRDKLNMEPEKFFDYFRNYEDDMIRIVGFLGIHLLNEYGGLIEKILENEWLAKTFGYIFKQLKEMTLLFIPLDVIRDYNELLVNFLEGLAPPEMVDNVKQFTGKDTINYLFEGAQMALENLGIDFTELKDNVWEELRREKKDELVSSDPSLIDKTEEQLPKIIRIVQEVLMLIGDIFTLPLRVLISESHYGLKTAINSVVSEEEGLYGKIKARLDVIFDYIQEIRK